MHNTALSKSVNRRNDTKQDTGHERKQQTRAQQPSANKNHQETIIDTCEWLIDTHSGHV